MGNTRHRETKIKTENWRRDKSGAALNEPGHGLESSRAAPRNEHGKDTAEQAQDWRNERASVRQEKTEIERKAAPPCRTPKKRGENRILTARREISPKLADWKSSSLDRWKNTDWTGYWLSRKTISPKMDPSCCKNQDEKHNRISDRKVNHKTARTAQPRDKIKKKWFFIEIQEGLQLIYKGHRPPSLIWLLEWKICYWHTSTLVTIKIKLGSGK
jgi:hypothetical protein